MILEEIARESRNRIAIFEIDYLFFFYNNLNRNENGYIYKCANTEAEPFFKMVQVSASSKYE